MPIASQEVFNSIGDRRAAKDGTDPLVNSNGHRRCFDRHVRCACAVWNGGIIGLHRPSSTWALAHATKQFSLKLSSDAHELDLKVRQHRSFDPSNHGFIYGAGQKTSNMPGIKKNPCQSLFARKNTGSILSEHGHREAYFFVYIYRAMGKQAS